MGSRLGAALAILPAMVIAEALLRNASATDILGYECDPNDRGRAFLTAVGILGAIIFGFPAAHKFLSSQKIESPVGPEDIVEWFLMGIGALLCAIGFGNLFDDGCKSPRSAPSRPAVVSSAGSLTSPSVIQPTEKRATYRRVGVIVGKEPDLNLLICSLDAPGSVQVGEAVLIRERYSSDNSIRLSATVAEIDGLRASLQPNGSLDSYKTGMEVVVEDAV